MLKRHKDQLINRLEKCVITQGWCIISHDELKLWYGQKITKTIWSDLEEKLKAICEEEGVEFSERTFSFYVYDGKYLIADKSEMQEISESASS